MTEADEHEEAMQEDEDRYDEETDFDLVDLVLHWKLSSWNYAMCMSSLLLILLPFQV